MATTYKNLAQAQAAYDAIQQQKDRLQRNDYIREQQAVMGVNNYLKQNGYNGGTAESILLRARGNRSDVSSYDTQLADLAALISRFRSRSMGGGVVQPITDLNAAEKLSALKRDRILKKTSPVTYRQSTTGWIPGAAHLIPQMLRNQQTVK